MQHRPASCDHPGPAGARCDLPPGHAGDHEGAATWPAALSDDTAKLPPYRVGVLRRPPPVPVRELTGPELLRALAEQIESEDPDELHREPEA